MIQLSDSQARERALDPEVSFIVQAPAGSGKTELLIQRYLKLLARVEKPEEILCMTFTRKAAGEMRTRILNALHEAQGEPPHEPHKLLTWNLARAALKRDHESEWQLLDHPARLKIQTIDSFCAWLTRHMPIASGMGGFINPDEHPHRSYREAAFRILSQLEENNQTGQNVKTILAHLDNLKGTFLDSMVQLLEQRDQWMIPFFEKLKLVPKDKEWLQNNLKGIVESILETSDKDIPPAIKEGIPPLANHSGERMKHISANDEITHLAGLQSFPPPLSEHLSQWKAIARLFLTDEDQLRKRVDKRQGFPSDTDEDKTKKKAFTTFLESQVDNDRFQKALSQVRKLPDPRFNDTDWKALSATLELLNPLAASLREVFTQQGKTDFSEISFAALKALYTENPDTGELQATDLMLHLDYRLKHILVDEYQDTSFKQHELMKRITSGWQPGDGRTLFIVGDPMQSIYRFRDAQVGLFMEAQKSGLGPVMLEPLTLLRNFRSQEKVVDWVNQCFNAIFPPHPNSDMGAVSYSASEATKPADEAPAVFLHPYPKGQSRKEAEELADLVIDLKTRHPEKSIAILVRARSHLSDIVRIFRERQIAYHAGDIDPLTSRWEILDLLALLRALRDMGDRVSWLSILRAPWCGLSMKDLHQLCLSDGKSTTWELMNNPQKVSTLTQDGQSRLQRMVGILQPTLEALEGGNFRDVLEGCWIQLGGPSCVPETSWDDIDVFFDEISRLIESGESYQLDRFDKILDSLYSIPPSGEENVHILTMHRAKGLEFDFVLLPGLGRKPGAEKRRLMFWMPHKEKVLLAPIKETGGESSPVYEFLRSLDKQKNNFETLRLLYVSATRAKHQLHLFGHILDHSKTPQPTSGSMLSFLWPYIKEEWMEQWQTLALSETKEESQTPYPNTIYRLPTDFQAPTPSPALTSGTLPSLQESDGALEDWSEYSMRVLGTVLHRVFKDIADEGLSQWDANRIQKLRTGFMTALKSHGVAGNRLEEITDRGMEALGKMLSDPTGRWILDKHEDDHAEFALTLTEGEKVIQRIIDRTFADEGIRWIIDYKTGAPETSADREKYIESEKQRYAPQLESYARIMTLRGETRPIKKALYNPLLQELILL